MTHTTIILISTELYFYINFLVLDLAVTHSSAWKAPICERACTVWSQVAVTGTLWRCPLDERHAVREAGGAAPPTGCTSLNESTLESDQNPASAAELHEHYNEEVNVKEQSVYIKYNIVSDDEYVLIRKNIAHQPEFDFLFEDVLHPGLHEGSHGFYQCWNASLIR